MFGLVRLNAFIHCIFMNILYWNCRGIDNDNTRRCLFHFCKRFSPKMVGLAKPMITISSLSQRFLNSLNMDVVAFNTTESH